jgi:hypothetical protein
VGALGEGEEGGGLLELPPAAGWQPRRHLVSVLPAPSPWLDEDWANGLPIVPWMYVSLVQSLDLEVDREEH